MNSKIEIKPGRLTLAELRRMAKAPVGVRLEEKCKGKINASVQTVGEVIRQGRVIYGINTGFGLLANTIIPNEELEHLQRSLILSHAAGVGAFMADSTVRLMMVLKINSLARGYSGIRLEVIEALVQLLNAEVYPSVPQKGSVGASGDLAPLAHMSIVLLGEGEASYRGQRLSGREGLELAGLSPITLGPKEGLALLNGTQASTAFALQGLFAAEELFATAMVSGSLSLDAALGSRRPFNPLIHAVRGHKSQIDVAASYRQLLEHSEIERSHKFCEAVQDPYSLRCQPQVMGACLNQIRNAAEVIGTEANAVSDNPLVFCKENDIISGGNFHAEPIAMVADNLALAIAEIGALPERRTALLIDSHMSGLPPFLVDKGGLNSGFMIAQVTAAALASENKSLAHPASVDSLPTSANQEDHVSMATFAARRLLEMADNTAGILAIELLAACQGIDFRAPLKTSPLLEEAKSIVRQVVAFYDQDRYLAPDIKNAQALVQAGAFNHLVSRDLLPSFNR
ncbi:histidine ammonia-lyase [Desulfotalea psychrophila]|uniref:Histidine ammonia-lyase n=1 Tax=Desulfotalea psychrophila (strain LSv54 / DSM 12343) TaxID=177439 RepID=HUTH_DESPS|nr:histidine ammonia-lyase [Desulfotalea psychrophila]Q6AKP3.1 RecName: Full=Histidine ammonia-lyase; Short=Histidase [Desulfotalea psychrophila LSv54]CAG37082.1 probable histidine ammonia-lyase [Desulfotalea psychrophila LSv54]